MERATVLYDDDCGFCRWSLAWFLRWDRDRRLRPAAIQGPEGERLLEGMPRARRLESWHLVDAEGRTYSAGEGFAPLLRLLPGGRPLAAIAARLPRLADRAYFLVARNRSALAKPLPRSGVERATRLIEARGG